MIVEVMIVEAPKIECYVSLLKKKTLINPVLILARVLT